MSIPEFPDHRQKVQRERGEKKRKALATEKFKLGVILVMFAPAWLIAGAFLVFTTNFDDLWFTVRGLVCFLATGLPALILGLWLLWKPRSERRKDELTKRLAREGRLDEMEDNTASRIEPTEDVAP